LVKIGQTPSLADIARPDTAKYLKALGNKALSELNKAIGLAAHGVGIGSYIYLRRVFESLVEDAHQKAAMREDWGEEAYQRGRMNERVALLRHDLPEFLVETPPCTVFSVGTCMSYPTMNASPTSMLLRPQLC
jgi:hypothetical protein